MGKWGEVIDFVWREDPDLPGCASELSTVALELAAEMAGGMEFNKLTGGFESKAGDTTLQSRFMSIAAQFGGAIPIGLEPEQTSDYQKGRADVGQQTEIRSSTATLRGEKPGDIDLRLYERETTGVKGERAFVLVIAIDGTGRRWWTRGFMIAKETRTYPRRKYHPADRDACYWVPQSALKVEPVPEVQELLRRRRG